MASAVNPELPESFEDIVRKQFACFADVKAFMQRFGAHIQQTFIIKSSEKLQPDAKNSENVVYKRLWYGCKVTGKTRTRAGLRNNSTNKQDCPCLIKISPTRDHQFLEIKSAVLSHENHTVSKVFNEVIPENRRLSPERIPAFVPIADNEVIPENRILSPESQKKAKEFLKMRCNKELLRRKIIDDKKIHVTLEELSSLEAELKCSDDDSLAKAVKLLETKYGAAVEVLHEAKHFKGMFFVTSDMKNSMSSWPEFVCIGGTDMLLNTELTVMTLIVEDGNGNSVVVGIGLLAEVDRTIFDWFLRCFKNAHTKACSRIQSIMADENRLERDVLKEVFPGIPIYICRLHTLRTFKRMITKKLAGVKRDQCLYQLEKFVYSSSEEEYNKLYIEFQKTAPKAVLEYFDANWHDIRTDWSTYSMNKGNLNNMTNNRVKSLNSRIKSFVGKNNFLVGFIENLFTWLHSHNSEANAKTATVFTKRPTQSYDTDSDKQKFSDNLMPFAFKNILAEINEHRDVKIEEILDEKKKKCSIWSNHRLLTVSDLTCECNESISTFLPCRHIFAVRKYFKMPLFAEELCSKRWTKNYTMESFKNAELKRDKSNERSAVVKIKEISPKPLSVEEKRKILAPIMKELEDLLINSSDDVFESRLDLLRKICDAWRQGYEVRIVRVNNTEKTAIVEIIIDE